MSDHEHDWLIKYTIGGGGAGGASLAETRYACACGATKSIATQEPRAEGPASKLSGYHSLAKFPSGVDVVGLATFKDRLFVALSIGVYELVGEELVLLKFKDVTP